jgi:hypothetical protein
VADRAPRAGVTVAEPDQRAVVSASPSPEIWIVGDSSSASLGCAGMDGVTWAPGSFGRSESDMATPCFLNPAA